MKRKKLGYIAIEKTRSKKQPFKVKVYAQGNTEVLSTSENLTTLANCYKNIRAQMEVFGTAKVAVLELNLWMWVTPTSKDFILENTVKEKFSWTK